MSERKRGTRWPVAVAVAAALMLACGLLRFGIFQVVQNVEEALRGPPEGDLLVIAIDDLRADHLPAYGYGYETAPNLTALAADGFVVRDYVPATVATGPCLATLMTGEPPWEHGFLSARELGHHRLAGEAGTLAEARAAAGFRTIGAIALRQHEDRLSGLGQGFDAYADAGLPRGGEPRAAVDVLAAVRDELEHALAGDDPVFAFVHLADLRERNADDDRFLAAQLAPFDDVLPPELLAGGVQEARRVVGRRRGSPEWLAFRSAIYDAQIHALDSAVGELFDLFRDAGRYDYTSIVVVGTRARFLDEERPPDGAPEPFSEGLLNVPLIVKPTEGASLWLDHLQERPIVGTTDLARALGVGSEKFEVDDSATSAVVVGPGLRNAAVVREERKWVFPVGDEASARLFDRTDDAEVLDDGVVPEVGDDVVLPGPHGIVLTVTADDDKPIDLSLRSPRGDLVDVEVVPGDAPVVPRPSPAGTSLGLSVRGNATVFVRTDRRATPLAIELAEPLERHELSLDGVALLPSAPDPDAPPRVRIERISSGWRALHVGERPEDRGRRARAVLLAYPPKEFQAAPEIRPVAGVAVVHLSGRGGVGVEGTAPFTVEYRLRAKQRAAVVARIGHRPVAWSEIASEDGGSGLELYLPPWRSPALLGEGESASNPRLRVERRHPVSSIDVPPPLLREELRFLERLGPYE